MTKLQRKRQVSRWRREWARRRKCLQDRGVTACRLELGRDVSRTPRMRVRYRPTDETFVLEPGDALLFVRRGGSEDSRRRRGGPHFVVRQSFTRRTDGFLMVSAEDLDVVVEVMAFA